MERSSTDQRRRVIRRPRLTRLLDDASASVVLLTAPAGYGKTTLAREWLQEGNKPAVWYACSAASRDVAALAVGLASAAAVSPAEVDVIRTHVRHAPDLEVEVADLASTLATTLSLGEQKTCLVIDDYQAIVGSDPAEAVIEILSQRTTGRVLIATRERPRWVTARKLLYGEVQELSRSALAMTPEEAAEVLARPGGGDVRARGLVALADGWPAAIGLAAVSGTTSLPDDTLPDELHDFLAEEVYAEANPALRKDLALLAVLPAGSHDLAGLLLGDRVSGALAEASRVGFLAVSRDGSVEMHPLIRRFLHTKIDATTLDTATHEIFEVLVAHNRWDDAYSLAEARGDCQLVARLLAVALEEMLAEGRVGSIERWLEFATRRGVTAPTALLAEAEVALRRGEHARAEALALSLARSDDVPNGVAFRAWICAGRSAHFVDRYEQAHAFFTEAQRIANTDAARREALWGLFLATHQIDQIGTGRVLEEYERLSDGAPETTVRLFLARYQAAAAGGGLERLVAEGRATAPVAARTRDPYVRSSFYDAFARVLILNGHYEEALPVASRELEEGRKYGLKFVFPSALCGRALIEMGLRRFASAVAFCDEATLHAEKIGDVHGLYQAAVIRARVHLVDGDAPGAVDALNWCWERPPGAGMWSEFIATRALAYACANMLDIAEEELARVKVEHAVEAKVTAAAATAVIALRRDGESPSAACERLHQTIVRSGALDLLVTAYRAEPQLLDQLGLIEPMRALLATTLQRARDEHLADRAGVSLPRRSTPQLTKREVEVLRLIREGKTNREIAEKLVISESTAKLHVRHILSKIGARSRTEAAIRAAALTDI